MLQVYQFEDHPLVQITDGRRPLVEIVDPSEWKPRHQIPATESGVLQVLSVEAYDKYRGSHLGAAHVLDMVNRGESVQLEKFQLGQKWREKWAPKYDENCNRKFD